MAGLEDIRRAKRVLFVHQFLAMGDALFLSPVYKNIKDNVPGIKIYVLTNRYSAPFVKSIPYVDGVYDIQSLMGGRLRLVKLVKFSLFFLKARLDTIVLRGDERMPQRAIEMAAKVCGLKRVVLGPYLVKEVREDRHIVETYLKILEAAGFNIEERGRLYVDVPASSVNEAKTYLGGETKNLVGMAPTSNMQVKNWAPSKTAELIRGLKDMSFEVLLFSADESFVKEVLSLVEVKVIGIVDFQLLTGIVSKCRGFIGVDTGLTHLATALGVPTVGLYGPTSENVTGLYGTGNMALHDHRDCPYYSPTAPFDPKKKKQECYSEDKCKLPITNCLEGIGVADVTKAFLKLQNNIKG